MSEGPRVRIVSTGSGPQTVVTVGDEVLTNVYRVELVIDARDVVRAVIHLYDIDVDVDLSEHDVIAMLTPMSGTEGG